jgi:hypothetical protein
VQINDFWEEYIFHNHDLDRLYKEYENRLTAFGFKVSEDIINKKFENILNIIKSNDDLSTINPKMLAVALYLENIKYIRKVLVNKRVFPQKVEEIAISPYDHLMQHFKFGESLFGDKIAIINNNNTAEIKVLVAGFKVKNIEYFGNINLKTMFKDIVINDEPILYYLDTSIALI